MGGFAPPSFTMDNDTLHRIWWESRKRLSKEMQDMIIEKAANEGKSPKEVHRELLTEHKAKKLGKGLHEWAKRNR